VRHLAFLGLFVVLSIAAVVEAVGIAGASGPQSIRRVS
jgi:hypothetical protein